MTHEEYEQEVTPEVRERMIESFLASESYIQLLIENASDITAQLYETHKHAIVAIGIKIREHGYSPSQLKDFNDSVDAALESGDTLADAVEECPDLYLPVKMALEYYFAMCCCPDFLRSDYAYIARLVIEKAEHWDFIELAIVSKLGI